MPFVREKNKIERETSGSGTWKKKVGRENAFTSDFRIFHVTVSRFSLPAFFLSRSILGRFTFNLFCFTFDFRGFHVTFSARSQPKR